MPKGAVKKLRSAPCPAPYAVRVASNIDPAEARDARHGIFQIAGQRVEITRKMNWRYDPLGSPSFRARLHDLRWLDTLLYSYRTDGNRRALRRAKRIVVDWVKQNPLASPSTDRTWFDKVVGDRAPYIAYVTRAAQCAGMLGDQRLARKLLSAIDTHTDFLATADQYSATNRGLFMDLGLLLSGRQARFLPGSEQEAALRPAPLRADDRLADRLQGGLLAGELDHLPVPRDQHPRPLPRGQQEEASRRSRDCWRT